MSKSNVEPVDRTKVGARCLLGGGVRHTEFAGQRGRVKQAVKSRGVYVVALDSGRLYDAHPSNVIWSEA